MTRVYAVPSVAPARPVRPMRCVWSSSLLATSKLTTVLMAGMSSPREATSVAMSLKGRQKSRAPRHGTWQIEAGTEGGAE